MDKNDIIEYVMNTPHNTNPAVLSGMLDSMGGRIELKTDRFLKTSGQGGGDVASLTKIGPVVFCQWSGISYESGLTFSIPEGFEPGTNTKTSAYMQGGGLQVTFGGDRIGFSFTKVQNTENEYKFSLFGNESSLVGKKMNGACIYFVEPDADILLDS